MEFSRTQIAIAVGTGVLILLVFFGYLIWLNNQGPVLSRSDEVDPLSGTPNSISLNPLRDRTSEHVAAKYLDAMRGGHCQEELAVWEKDYRKKYARFICDSETKHPLLSLNWSTGKMRRRSASCIIVANAATTSSPQGPTRSCSRLRWKIKAAAGKSLNTTPCIKPRFSTHLQNLCRD